MVDSKNIENQIWYEPLKSSKLELCDFLRDTSAEKFCFYIITHLRDNLTSEIRRQTGFTIWEFIDAKCVEILHYETI